MTVIFVSKKALISKESLPEIVAEKTSAFGKLGRFSDIVYEEKNNNKHFTVFALLLFRLSGYFCALSC